MVVVAKIDVLYGIKWERTHWEKILVNPCMGQTFGSFIVLYFITLCFYWYSKKKIKTVASVECNLSILTYSHTRKILF